MNYLKLYYSIIEKAKDREKLRFVHENHHIIPKCIGGSDDKENIVTLTTREHYLCHWLLTKMYPENNSLFYAFNMMNIANKKQIGRSADLKRTTTRTYKKRKSELSVRMSLTQSGRIYITDGVKNKKVFPEDILPEGWKRGRTFSENHLSNVKNIKRSGIPIHTDEWKKTLSENRSGKNNTFYGKSHSDEVKLKISKANSKPRSSSFKEKVSNTFKNKRKKLIELYEITPKLCQCCGKVLSFEKRKLKFCSISCSNKSRKAK